MDKESKNIERQMNSKFGIFCLILTSFCLAMLVGFHMSVVNPLTSYLQVVYNETYKRRYNESMPESVWLPLQAFSQSSAIIGAFITTVSIKFLLNYVSSKQIIQFSHVTNIIGILLMTLGCGLGGSYEAFIIGRLLVGIPCGASYGLLPIFVAEMAEKSSCEFWQSVIGVFIAFGMMITPILAYPLVFGTQTLWPVVLGVGGFPSVLFLLSSFLVPNSPVYLIRKKNRADALISLKKLRKNNQAALNEELDEIEREINTTATMLGLLAILKKKQYRNQFIAVVALMANLMFLGINNMILYSNLVFSNAGIPRRTTDLALIGIFSAQFVVACFGSKLVDRFGGKRVNVLANVLTIVTLTIFTVSQATRDKAPEATAYISIASLGIFVVVWAGASNVATISLIGTLTIESTRATCLAYGGATLWVTSWIVGFVPPYLQIAFGAYSMVIWIVCSVLFLIYMLICLPETKGKTTEEIQSKFRGKVSTNSIRSTRPLNEL